MFKLEYFFLEHVRFYAIQLSETLSREFLQYSRFGYFEPTLITDIEFNPNYNWDNQYREILENSYDRYEKGMDYFENYNDIPGLLEYCYHVSLFARKQGELLKKTYKSHKKMMGYIEEDSSFVGIQMDRPNLTCTLEFNRVAAYDDHRINKSIPVDVINLNIVFKKVKHIKMFGSLNYEAIVPPKVHKIHCSKEKDDNYCYSLYARDGTEPVLLEIIFSDMDLIKKSI